MDKTKNQKNPNSRKIRIMRKIPFMQQAQKPEDVRDYYDNAFKAVGSSFESAFSTKPRSGLSEMEERVLLPSIINVDPEQDRTEYRKARDTFFAELSIKVPPGGTELEIGLEVDNDAPIFTVEKKTKKIAGIDYEVAEPHLVQSPIDPMGYIMWKFALSAPNVAADKEESDLLPFNVCEFYIYDKTSEERRREELRKLIIQVNKVYHSIQGKTKKVTEILLALGHRVDQMSDYERNEALHNRIYNNKNKDELEQFLDLVNDDMLAELALVEEFLAYGVLKRYNTSIIDPEDLVPLGDTVREVAVFLRKKDEDAKARLSQYKSKLRLSKQ